ncbi:ABC transporter permease [Catenulispora sp. NL8]|uniref:ABC transporter permease n=1 Tax=Catenulispora pinistramenti TaxID=2705254 RepID=A0ABS5L1B7_9ACTN|nr:ABC transporter permease [Catenulispora pinistramenti]MBS2552123.1 ABC transporter permease [Catenulispora pinistramenti]
MTALETAAARESADPIRAAEPVGAADRTGAAGSTERAEPTEPIESANPAGPAESADQTEPADPAPAPGAAPAALEPLELLTPRVRRTRRRPRGLAFALRALGPIAILAGWWTASATGVLTKDLLASPPEVFGQAVDLWRSGQLSAALTVSLARAGTGLLIGVTAGLLLGVTAGFSRVGDDLLDSAVQTLRALPFLSLVPLFMVWFGIGEAARVILIAVATTFPMYVSTSGAVRTADPKLLEAARTFGLGRWATVRRIVLPGALPAILSGLRLSTTLSVIALIAAEEINSTAGLGYLMAQAQNFSRTDILTVCILIYGLLGLSADIAIRALERVLMPWRAAAGGAR